MLRAREMVRPLHMFGRGQAGGQQVCGACQLQQAHTRALSSATEICTDLHPGCSCIHSPRCPDTVPHGRLPLLLKILAPFYHEQSCVRQVCRRKGTFWEQTQQQHVRPARHASGW